MRVGVARSSVRTADEHVAAAESKLLELDAAPEDCATDQMRVIAYCIGVWRDQRRDPDCALTWETPMMDVIEQLDPAIQQR